MTSPDSPDEDTRIKLIMLGIERIEIRVRALAQVSNTQPPANPHASGGLWEVVHSLSARVKALESQPTAAVDDEGDEMTYAQLKASWEDWRKLYHEATQRHQRARETYQSLKRDHERALRVIAEYPTKPPFPPDLAELVRAARYAYTRLGATAGRPENVNAYRELREALEKFGGVE